MSNGSTGDVLLLLLVVSIVLYVTVVIDIRPVLVAFGDGQGMHVGDLVIFLLAFSVLALPGKRIADRTK